MSSITSSVEPAGSPALEASAQRTMIAPDLLRRLETPGPRYTSYPSADRFNARFTESNYIEALAQRAELSALDCAPPLALYVHLPFCESLCYYCACNKVVTRHHSRAAEYLRALEVEIARLRHALGPRQHVTQLHYGGGTPTFFSDEELARLTMVLRDAFNFQSDAECSIEIDPRGVDAQRLAHLASLGFKRISFGVQDFDADVQRAVHRIQPFDDVAALVRAARALGFESINVDLIYGLPKQNAASFARTIGQITDLKPDRIALYRYAHLPLRFKAQRRILSADLPDAETRLNMLDHAVRALTDFGYAYIGMDHFALHDDALAIAKREQRLHRNFQGYSTRPECDVLGLGASAISQIGASYAQNARLLADYYAAMFGGRLATERGITLDQDDALRRRIIMDLMCRGRLDFGRIRDEFGVDPRLAFPAELAKLAPFTDAGLLLPDEDGLAVSPTGWYVVRAIAMAFDRYLDATAPPSTLDRYSRLI